MVGVPLYRDHSHNIHDARRATPNKDRAKPEGKPRTENTPRSKTVNLKDNTQ